MKTRFACLLAGVALFAGASMSSASTTIDWMTDNNVQLLDEFGSAIAASDSDSSIAGLLWLVDLGLNTTFDGVSPGGTVMGDDALIDTSWVGQGTKAPGVAGEFTDSTAHTLPDGTSVAIVFFTHPTSGGGLAPLGGFYGVVTSHTKDGAFVTTAGDKDGIDTFQVGADDVQALTAVPEPHTVAILAFGLGAAFLVRRRKTS